MKQDPSLSFSYSECVNLKNEENNKQNIICK